MVEYLKKKDGFTHLYRPLNPEWSKVDVLRFEQYEYNEDNVVLISERIQSHLKPHFISDQFKEKYPKGHPRWSRKYFGLCVPASFVFLYLFDTDKLSSFRATDEQGEHHWWIEDTHNKKRFDLTAEQYTDEEKEPLYNQGKKTRLYSFKEIPQKRFLDLIALVVPHSKRYITDEKLEEPTTLDDFIK